MPAEDSLLSLSDVASPQRKRARMETEVPQSIRALQDAESYFAFYVLSNSISTYRAGEPLVSGPLGFHGIPQDSRCARVILLAWACAAPGEVPRGVASRYVAIPGVVDGEVLGDVLMEFADALLHAATTRFRVVTFNMELSAGILMQEMERCQLHHAREHLERAVRTYGFDLMDPTVYAWLHGKAPAYPALPDIASAMPLGQRGFPEFRTGADEVALYLHFATALREMGRPACQLAGHMPIRVARGCMRDNGMHSHDCARCGRYLD